MKRNVYTFVHEKYSAIAFTLKLNGTPVGSCWRDCENWYDPNHKDRYLVFWQTRKHSGFAYSYASAKDNMLACAKQEVEHERRARYRK